MKKENNISVFLFYKNNNSRKNYLVLLPFINDLIFSFEFIILIIFK